MPTVYVTVYSEAQQRALFFCLNTFKTFYSHKKYIFFSKAVKKYYISCYQSLLK